VAVYAPGDDPTAGQGQDPGMWARLMGFVGGMNPIGSAQAGEAPPPGPGPVDPDAAARQAAIERLKPQMANPGNTNAPAIMPHMFGDGPNVQGRPVMPYIDPRTGQIADASRIPTDLPPAAAPAFHQPDHPSTMRFPMWPTPPAPAAAAPPAIGSPAPAVPPPRPVAQPVRKPARIPANATASVPPAGSPWVTQDMQNTNPTGGALGRGGYRQQMGMLDLSKLFGQR
jgi:hypothetical protein